jgi:hypothetical protein
MLRPPQPRFTQSTAGGWHEVAFSDADNHTARCGLKPIVLEQNQSLRDRQHLVNKTDARLPYRFCEPFDYLPLLIPSYNSFRVRQFASHVLYDLVRGPLRADCRDTVAAGEIPVAIPSGSIAHAAFAKDRHRLTLTWLSD